MLLKNRVKSWLEDLNSDIKWCIKLVLGLSWGLFQLLVIVAIGMLIYRLATSIL